MSLYTNTFLSLFFKEVNKIIKSGLSLEIGMESLSEDEQNPVFSNIYNSMIKGLKFSEAVELEHFPNNSVNLLKTAEETGRLEEISLYLQRYYEREERIKRSVKSAIMIPLIVFFIMTSVLFILIMEVLPIFKNCFNQIGIETSGFINVLMGLREGILSISTVFIALSIIVCLLFIIIFYNKKYRKKFLSYLNQKVKVLQIFQYVRCLSMISIYLDNGFDEEYAIEKSCVFDDSGGFKRVLELYKNGENFGNSLYKCGIIDREELQLIKLGKQTGKLSEILGEISENKERISENKLNMMINSVEPTIIIIVSILAGIILLSILMPLLGVLSAW